MALTKAMVIFDPASRKVLRIYVAEDDDHYAQFHEPFVVGEGERFTYMNIQGDPRYRSSLPRAENAVAAAMGYPPVHL